MLHGLQKLLLLFLGLQPHIIKDGGGGGAWRTGSVLESTGYFSTRSGFNFQNPHENSQPSIILVSRDPMLFAGL